MAAFTSALQELGSRVVQITDQKFTMFGAANEVRYNIEDEMASYRAACQTAILADIPAAKQHHIDIMLWTMHTRIHGKFRAALQKIVAARQQGTALHRRTGREYVAFIKASQNSYRDLLRAINAQYPTVSNLRNIAQAFSTEIPTIADTRKGGAPTSRRISEKLKEVVVDVTCDTLLHLGDLSRWRYGARLDGPGDSGWKTAASFYELAHEVNPSSGLAKHQEAVLALVDNKFFYALSLFYQSLCAQRQHPEAAKNLDLLLRKSLDQPMSELIKAVQPKNNDNAVGTLRAWFLRLHVQCYHGQEFSAHDEMETEILARLSNALKSGADLSSTLFHMVMINIAGESVAVEKAQRSIDPVKNAQAYFFFLRHNVKTFLGLLVHLREQLDAQARKDFQRESIRAEIPPVAETVMFSVRLYTLWFTKNWNFLQKCMETNKPDIETASGIRNLAIEFTAVLNAIFEQYPLGEALSTRDCEYLLKEEEATMGFLPLHGDWHADVWARDGQMKTVLRMEKSKEQQQREHLMRLRDIFSRGVNIAQDQASPFFIVEKKLLFEDPGATTSEFFSPTPAQEQEGEPITPPPTAGGDAEVLLAGSTEDLEQAQGLWLDGANDGRFQANQSQSQAQAQAQKPVIAVEQLIQKAYYTPHEPKTGVEPPAQMPWLLSFPDVDSIWRNDHSTVKEQSSWPNKPFEQKPMYPSGT